MSLRESTIFASGDFVTIGGQTRPKVAELDLTSGLATSWNPPSMNNAALSMVLDENTVFLGGMFGVVDGVSHPFAVGLDVASGAVTSWNPQVSGFVHALAKQGNSIFVGGSFNTLGGAPRWYLGAVDDEQGNAIDWITDATAPVYAILPCTSSILVGGGFSSVAYCAQNGLAMIEAPATTAVAPSMPRDAGTLRVTGGPIPSTGNVGVRFELSRPTRVSIQLFDPRGRLVHEVWGNRFAPAGRIDLQVSLAGLPPGIYFCRVETPEESSSIKFVRLR
jgi:hypothetical protein